MQYERVAVKEKKISIMVQILAEVLLNAWEIVTTSQSLPNKNEQLVLTDEHRVGRGCEYFEDFLNANQTEGSGDIIDKVHIVIWEIRWQQVKLVRQVPPLKSRKVEIIDEI